jgi:Domain of unknown function (DUF1840)
MIYEFKCKATGNLIMTQTVGDQVLDLIDKRSAKGVITVPEMPRAIEQLRAALAGDKKRAQDSQSSEPQRDNKGLGAETQPTISLGQRLVPFIEMLEGALAANKDIVWGV